MGTNVIISLASRLLGIIALCNILRIVVIINDTASLALHSIINYIIYNYFPLVTNLIKYAVAELHHCELCLSVVHKTDSFFRSSALIALLINYNNHV